MMRRWMVVVSLACVAACGGDDKKKKKPEPPPVVAGLSVGNPAVRSCDVLLSDGAGQLASVTFAETVIGETQRWAPRTALSFVLREDTAPRGSLATLNLQGGVSITQATCYDRLGATVASPEVTLR